LYSDITVLNGKSSELNTLTNYDTHILENDPMTQAILKNSDTITDLLNENTTTQ